jgi:hypothetical protein
LRVLEDIPSLTGYLEKRMTRVNVRYALVAALTIILISVAGILSCFGTPGVGDVVHKGVWQIKVASVKEETTLSAKLSAKAGYSYLVVEVQISNTSTQTQGFNSSSFSLADSKERIYTPVGFKTRGVDYQLNTDWLFTTVTGPGKISAKSPTYIIVFLVSNSASGFYFKYFDLPAINLGQ